MAVIVYKWLMLLLLFSAPAGHKTGVHPFHVGTLEINHNATEKTLEISSRLFTDDFEAAISKMFKVQADLSGAAMKEKMNPLVEKYLKSHFAIVADGKTLQPEYLGFEKDGEAVYAYFQVENMNAPKQVEVTDTRFYDQFDDQINIIHVKVNGKRQSSELKYPKTKTTFQF